MREIDFKFPSPVEIPPASVDDATRDDDGMVLDTNDGMFFDPFDPASSVEPLVFDSGLDPVCQPVSSVERLVIDMDLRKLCALS